MTTNFRIKSFTELDFYGRHIDLHNNFSFRPELTEEKGDVLRIHFDKSKGDWVPKAEFEHLTFTLTKVNYLKTVEPDPKYISDDDCLAGITYYYSDERDENCYLLDKDMPADGDDIIFSFESDRIIRVNCDTITLSAR